MLSHLLHLADIESVVIETRTRREIGNPSGPASSNATASGCWSTPGSPTGSCDGLVYTRSDRGFALISRRTDTVQRMYFQCDPDEPVTGWSDDQIWAELQARVAGEDGFTLREGPIIAKSVLPFRSYVCEPMRWPRN